MSHSEVVGLGGDEELALAVLATVRAVTRDDPPVRIVFEELPERHLGLGTGTAARMAAIAGAAHIAGQPLSVAEMARHCSRGGTSGIGVNAFAVGGVIFDGGHTVESEEPFFPSRYQTPKRVPPIITRLLLPPEWQVLLLYPKGEEIAGQGELEFFQRELPVPSQESLLALGYAYHGIAPAVQERDIRALGYALRQIHSVGFKRRELAQQPDDVRNLLSQLQAKKTVAAGMSSLGPLIFAITQKHDQASNDHVYASAVSAGTKVQLARPADSGHLIESLSDEEL